MASSEKNYSSEKDVAVDIENPSVSDLQELTGDGVNEAYKQKCHLINECLQYEIGFGRYQLELFILSGFGWLADNLWLQGAAVLLPQINIEFNPPRVEFVTLAVYVGLILGAITWGSLSDIIGRKLSWQITLFIAGTFGIACGAAPTFVALCSLAACTSFGIGGNLPVDGALFLENIPQSHQWLLTFLSAFWSVGQVVGSLVVWGFLAHFSNEKGWRYSLYTLGCITFAMFICRYFIFSLQESPKFLVATGRDEEAVEALTYIARRNGKNITLTTEQLLRFGRARAVTDRRSVLVALKNSFAHFSLSHVRPLFSTRSLAINSTLIILIWGTIGLAYPLFNAFLVLYLQDRVSFSSSLDRTYRDYVIIAVLGVPGSALACLIIDWTRGSGKWAIGGRKFALAISTLATGIFLFLFTTSTSEAAFLGWSCASSLTQNAMYGVLYAYTPEAFPTPHRGTGDALASSFNRITGILAPVIKIATTNKDGLATSVGPNIPVFVSASLFVVASVLAMLLPIETAGKAVL